MAVGFGCVKVRNLGFMLGYLVLDKSFIYSQLDMFIFSAMIREHGGIGSGVNVNHLYKKLY